MKKGNYVDGYVFTVPKNKIKEYRKMAQLGGKIWLKYGALDYMECMGDDLKGMSALTFPKLINLKKGETVWFSYIVFKSRAHRDSVNKKVMKYFSEAFKDQTIADMPNDAKRMAYGGFKVVVGS